MMRTILMITALLSLKYGTAQTTLTVQTVSQSGEPAGFATITAVSRNQPSFKITRSTDSSGYIRLKLNPGNYTLSAEAIGFDPLKKDFILTKKDTTVRIVLQPSAQQLKDVVVTARKPLMRQEDDKTIVDPENIALGTTNAYEVMERIPGLFMNQDGNIYLNSTSPSAIWINGREQRMSAADVATILKSLPPNSIDRIEIIRTPSARYDASGGGGIVNVILKKNVKIGLTGSVNAGISQGTYGNQFAGVNINNSDGKKSTSLNLNVSSRNSFEDLQTIRLISNDSLLEQNARTLFPGNSMYGGFVFSYELSPKWEITSDSRFTLNQSHNTNDTRSDLLRADLGNVLTATLASIQNNGNNLNASQGLNLKYKIDTLGSEWVNDLSYSYARNTNDQDILNKLSFPVSTGQASAGLFENDNHFFTWQSNLIKKLRHKITLESGVKTSNLWFNNTTNFYFTPNGQRVADNRRSNRYRYDEHIHAVYLQGAKTFGPFILKTGVRVENTNMNGQQLFPSDTAFRIRRTDAFPYVYLSRKLMSIAGYELRAYLVYRRTISRPSFSVLNPAIRVVDTYLYESGNPSLRPQFTQNYEANISVDERPLFALGINQTRDIFSQVIYPDATNRNIALRTYDNLGKNRELYFRMIAAIPPGKKYFFVAGAQYNHNLYDGRYENAPLTFSRGSWSVFTYHNLKLTKTTQLSMNGFLRLKGQLQFYELGNFGQLNLNLSQQLLRKKLTITTGIGDLFYTNRNTFILKQGSLVVNGERKADTRRVNLTLRYNFGIRKKEDRSMFDAMPTE